MSKKVEPDKEVGQKEKEMKADLKIITAVYEKAARGEVNWKRGFLASDNNPDVCGVFLNWAVLMTPGYSLRLYRRGVHCFLGAWFGYRSSFEHRIDDSQAGQVAQEILSIAQGDIFDRERRSRREREMRFIGVTDGQTGHFESVVDWFSEMVSEDQITWVSETVGISQQFRFELYETEIQVYPSGILGWIRSRLCLPICISEIDKEEYGVLVGYGRENIEIGQQVQHDKRINALLGEIDPKAAPGKKSIAIFTRRNSTASGASISVQDKKRLMPDGAEKVEESR